MNLKRRSVWGMMTGAGSVVIKTLLGIIIIPVLIGKLGVPMYGLYVLLVGILDVAGILDLGFTASLIKFLGAEDALMHNEKKHEVLLIGLWFYSAIAVLTLVLGWLLIGQFVSLFHIPQNFQSLSQNCMLIILAEAALTLYSLYFRSILLSHNLHPWTNLAETLFGIISNLVGLIFLLMGFGLYGLLWARLAAALVRLVILAVESLKIETTALMPPAKFNLQTAWNVVSLSFHAMMINLSVTISHKIDNFVIARFMPLEAVGIFEIVFRFLGIVLQITGRVCEVALPLFSRLLASAQTENVQSAFIKLSMFANFLVTQMLLFIVVFYPQLFHAFSAGKIPIEPTIPILWVAIPTVWSGVLQMPAGYYLFTANRQRLLSMSSIIAAGVNLVLSVILIQSYGLVGVALGTLIPQVIQHQAFLIAPACQSLNISPWQYVKEVHLKMLLPLAISALVMLVCRPLTLLLHPMLLVACGIGFIAVNLGALSWLLCFASQDEKQFLKSTILSKTQSEVSA